MRLLSTKLGVMPALIPTICTTVPSMMTGASVRSVSGMPVEVPRSVARP